MIVLCAEQRVGQHDANLARGHQQDQQHGEEEPEEVVPVAHPHGGQEEVQLHEDHAERHQAPHQNQRESADVPRLRRDLARDRAGGDGRLVGGSAQSAERAEHDEREGEAEPDGDELEDGEKRDGGGGVVGGGERVLQAVDAEDHGGEERAGEEDGALEVHAAPAAVEEERDVAVEEAHEHVQREEEVQRHAAILGGHHARQREQHAAQRHAEQLRAAAEQDGEEELAVLRGTEAVGVDHLPAAVLDVEVLVLIGGQLRVSQTQRKRRSLRGCSERSPGRRCGRR